MNKFVCYVLGMLMIPFVWALKQWLWSKSKIGNLFTVLGIVSGIISFVAFINVLFFDMQTALLIHDLASATFFSFTFFTSVFFTISMEINGKATKLQWGFTSTLVTLAITFFPWYFYTLTKLIFPLHPMTFEDWVQAMGSLDPKMDGVRYFEWLGVGFAIAWLIVTGITYHKFRILEVSDKVEEVEMVEMPEKLENLVTKEENVEETIAK